MLLAKQDLINRDDDAPAVRVFLTSARTHVVTIKKLLFATIYTSIITITIIILIMNLFIVVTITLIITLTRLEVGKRCKAGRD